MNYEVPDDYGMVKVPLPADNGRKYCFYCGGVKEVKWVV